MRKGSLRLGGIGLIYSYLQDIYFLQPSLLRGCLLASLSGSLVLQWAIEIENLVQLVGSQIHTCIQILDLIPTSKLRRKWKIDFFTFMVHLVRFGSSASGTFFLILEYDLKKNHTHLMPITEVEKGPSSRPSKDTTV